MDINVKMLYLYNGTNVGEINTKDIGGMGYNIGQGTIILRQEIFR